MLKKFGFIACAAAIACLTATTSYADNIRPVTLGNGQLQGVFDNIGSSLDASLDQSTVAYFNPQSSTTTVQNLFFENPAAAYRNGNLFGIYSAADPTKRLQVFGGPDSPVTTNAVSFLPGGSVQLFNQPLTNIAGFGKTFGFYLTNPLGDTFFSDDSLNGGNPQALIYAAQGDAVNLFEANDAIAGCQAGADCLSDANHWYVAFEDLPFANADRNFADLVVSVESITPVPEPGSMMLLGTGLFGLANAARRRFRKNQSVA